MLLSNTIANKIAVLIVLACVLAFGSAANDIKLTERAKVSILTCSPGADLYSTFGHSAIRIQDVIDGKTLDWVYNYGTFEFDEGFYLKFARGKLNYMLSKSDYGYFQYGYLQENRSIVEQTLNLSADQKQRLFDLLELNYLPENRYYLYDFFYDNCSTRIRDILQKALSDDLQFEYVEHDLGTFRDAIDSYMLDLRWSDLGIDIALGLPCDKDIVNGEDMFLPDYLYLELGQAKLGGNDLVSYDEEILPSEKMSTPINWLTPMFVFILLLAIYFFLVVVRRRTYKWLDNTLLFIGGFIGLQVLLLWFATDHTATANNFNLLWAVPFNIIFVFMRAQRFQWYWKAHSIVVLIAIISWFILPQGLNLALLPFAVVLLLASLRKSGWLVFGKA